MKTDINKKLILKYLLAFTSVFIAFILVAHPAYHGGLFISHDDVQVTRIQAMTEELRGGQFPVRYIDSFGNHAGYFLFNFYSPFIYYVGAIFVFLGFSSVTAVKLVYLLIIMIGSLGIFVLLKSKTTLFSSTIGTIVFLLSPYIFHDLFHRGALPEATALMITPWVLWSFIKIKERKINKFVFLISVISFSLTILSHVLTGALVGVLLLSLIFPIKNRKNIYLYFFSIFLSISLAAFYFLPALVENQYTQYENADLVANGYKSQFVEITKQAGSKEIINEKKPFLGLSLLFTLLVITYNLISKKFENKSNKNLAKVIIFVSVLSLLLMSHFSELIWANFRYLRYLQFPYRILTILTVILTLGFALVFDLVNKTIKIVLILTIFLATFIYSPYYKALGYQYVGKYSVEGECKTTAWNNEHLPKWVNKCIKTEPKIIVVPITEGLKLENIETFKNGRKIIFIPKERAGEIIINKYYFPGWTAENESGEKIEIRPSADNGLISIYVSETFLEKPIIVSLKNTYIRTIGNLISLLSIICLIIMFTYWNKIEKLKI